MMLNRLTCYSSILVLKEDSREQQPILDVDQYGVGSHDLRMNIEMLSRATDRKPFWVINEAFLQTLAINNYRTTESAET